MDYEQYDVLVICHQIGGSRAVGPVIHQLQQMNLRVLTLGYGLAAEGFTQQNIQFTPVSDTLPADANFRLWAEGILTVTCPQVVLSGTSSGFTPEKAVIEQAKQLGIPTVAVLDHWSNYVARFEGEGGSFHYLPVRLAIMDSLAQQDLLGLGYPLASLVITGQPYFDNIPTCLAQTDRQLLRSKYSIGQDERLLIFASEPQRQDYGMTLGYSEVDALRTLLESVAQINNLKWHIYIKPHPTEDESELQAIASQSPVKTTLINSIPPRNLMAMADVVVGMTSLFLIESALLGVPTLSFQPNLIGEDIFVGKRLFLIESAYSQEDCRNWLTQLTYLEGNLRRQRAETAWQRLGLDGRAALRVANLVRQFISH